MEETPVAAFSISDMPPEVRRKVIDLTVTVDMGRVRLEGNTNSFYIKQMAQEAVKKASPKSIVENRIQVEY